MQVLQCIGNLGNVLGRCALVKAPLRQLGQDLEQLAAPSKLQHHENTATVVEVAIHAQHIGVPQIHLDLNLSAQLQIHLVFHEFLFVYTLEGHYIALIAQTRRRHGFGPRQIHAPKLALAQRTPDLKVMQTPWPRRLVVQTFH